MSYIWKEVIINFELTSCLTHFFCPQIVTVKIELFFLFVFVSSFSTYLPQWGQVDDENGFAVVTVGVAGVVGTVVSPSIEEALLLTWSDNLMKAGTPPIKQTVGDKGVFGDEPFDGPNTHVKSSCIWQSVRFAILP